MKQASLASQSDIANLVNKIDFNDKLPGLNKWINMNKTKHVLVKNELNKLSEKVKLLSTKYYSFFLCRIYFTSNDRLQNMFDHQPTLDTLELRKEADNDYVISLKSKGVFNSKLKLLFSLLYTL